MDTYNEIWNAVLSYCEQRVTETAFNLWIKKTEFVSFEAATITLRLHVYGRCYFAIRHNV